MGTCSCCRDRPPTHPLARLTHRPSVMAIQAYVRRIEELVGVPVRWIGVGPGRLDVIDRGEDCTLRIDSLNRREFAN